MQVKASGAAEPEASGATWYHVRIPSTDPWSPITQSGTTTGDQEESEIADEL